VNVNLQTAGISEEEGYVEFWQTGTSTKGEFSCAECG